MYNPYQPNPYMPQYQNPYQARLDALTQPQNYPMQSPQPGGLIRVTGMDGAKAYQMGPNSATALFDANEDVFYVKTTDGASFPTIRAFRFEPIENAPAQSTEYVTRQEFEALKGMILNAQQPVPEQPQKPAGGSKTGK